VLFDLPHLFVINIRRRKSSGRASPGRVEVVGGDLLQEVPPVGTLLAKAHSHTVTILNACAILEKVKSDEAASRPSSVECRAPSDATPSPSHLMDPPPPTKKDPPPPPPCNMSRLPLPSPSATPD